MNAPHHAFYEATDDIRMIIRRARKEGRRVSAMAALYKSGDLTAPVATDGWRAERMSTAASINKLALALWALGVRAYADGTAPFKWTEEDRRSGDGFFDRPGAPLEATVEALLSDMLEFSSNTAMAVLGRNNFNLANAELRRRQYELTRLRGVGNEGRFETGLTTPEEALGMLANVLGFAPGTPLADAARESLASSRSYVRVSGLEGCWSKHGELDGPDNYSDYVRNEVGIMEGEDGFSVGYSVFVDFTSSHDKPIADIEARLAELLIGNIGGRLAKVIGGVPTRMMPRIGAVALSR